jgi:hypothetical protein
MAGLAGLRSLLEPGLEVPVKERGEKNSGMEIDLCGTQVPALSLASVLKLNCGTNLR